MATNPFVTSVVATAPSPVTAPSFGIPMLVSYNADHLGAARTATCSDLDAVVAAGWAAGTIEYRQASALFARHPGLTSRVESLIIGRGANKPTLVYTQSIAQVVAGGTYAFDVAIGTITDTALAVVAGAADIIVTTVTAATDLLTKVAHGLTTGQVIYLTTAGTFPAATPSLAINTAYWVIRIDDDNIKIATTYANAIAGTAIDLTSAGAGALTLVTTGNDVLAERIVSALNAVTSKNYTAATAGSTGSKTWTATGTTAGGWFSIGVDHDLVTSAVTNADAGIAADLTAIRNENATWYELHTSFNSTAAVTAAAAWIESNTALLQYSVDVSATATANAVVGAATTNDVADALRTLNRTRTAVWYHPDPRQCLSMAVSGRCLGVKPGGVQLALKQLSGVTPVKLNDTQRENLSQKNSFAGKNANSYTVLGGVAVTFYGRTSVGEWIDVIRDNDSVSANMLADLYQLELESDKLPLNIDGETQLKNVALARLDRAVSDGIYNAGSIFVEVVSSAKLTSTERRLRKFSEIKWSATLANAGIFLDAAGTVSF